MKKINITFDGRLILIDFYFFALVKVITVREILGFKN